jgi:uncharacterized protein (DUF1330 family)
MSAYWIGRARTRDPEALKQYGALVAKASSIYPQEALVRGGRYELLEGEDTFDRYVVIKFGSVEEALIYYHSPEYQEAAAIRHAACFKCELAIVEGID